MSGNEYQRARDDVASIMREKQKKGSLTLSFLRTMTLKNPSSHLTNIYSVRI